MRTSNTVRILFINSVYKYGSTGYIIANIKNELKSKGHEVKVAFGRHAERSDEDSIVIGNWLDILLSVIGSRLFDNHGLMNKRATRKFIREIDKQHFDIINLHNIHGYYINYPILFKYLAEKKVPVVWSLHDGWSMTGHAAYDKRFFSSLANVSQSDALRRYPAGFLFNRSKKNLKDREKYMSMLGACTITTDSKWLMTYVKNSYLGKYNKKVIHTGVDLSIFKPKKIERLNGKKVILGVASVWDDSKGLGDFMKLQSMIKSDFEIVMVGLTKKQIAALPIGIVGIRRTDSAEQLADLYNQADVFLNLTYEDNYPTTNLEALACGTSVITYDTGGSPEIISDCAHCVVDQGDLESIAKAISNVAGNTAKIDILRINKDTMIKEYIKLYNEIIRL